MIAKFGHLNQYVQSQYQYASYPFQRQIPLPSTSVKIPYRDKDLRIIKVNNQKKQIQELRSQIRRKCEVEEFHYQNKLREMKRQNQIHRQLLQQNIKHSNNAFDMPQVTSYYSSKPTHKYNKFRDSLDELSVNENQQQIHNHRRAPINIAYSSFHQTQSINGNAESRQSGRTHHSHKSRKQAMDSEEEEREKQEKSQRVKDLDFVYNKNKRPEKSKNFVLEPTKKEEEQLDVDRQNFIWVNKVRKQKKEMFMSEISQDNNEVYQSSSDESMDSDAEERLKQRMKMIENNKNKKKKK